MAIDPPYRLDPFQNIVNVHWRTVSGGYSQQVFIWRRWNGPPYNNGWNGDWYPVSDEFWADAFAVGQATQPKIYLYTCAYRENLSDLINAAMTLENLYAPGFPYPEYSFTFNTTWRNVDTVKGAWPMEQPTVNSSGTQTPIYSGILGTYTTDDMGTAFGHEWPPPFELPPLPP